MRVCELCCSWFQNALERYFDVMELSKTPKELEVSETPKEQEPSITTRQSSTAIGERSSMLTPSSPLIASGTNDEEEEEEPPKLRRRQSRHSISVVAPQKSASKPWFSGHLRAMHVGDRLPRKKTKTDGDLASADDESGDQDTRRRQVARSFDSSAVMSPSPEGEQLQNGNEEKGDDGILNHKEEEEAVAESGKHQDGVSQEAEQTGEEDIFQMEPVLASVVKPAPTQDSAEVKEGEEDDNSLERRHRKKTSKKSKFSRSASFDFTNLNSISPSSSTTSLVTAGNDDASDTSSSRSGKATEKTGLPRPKCFDDSDIVDSRARTDASDNSQKNNADLPATVLRFAVYKTGGNDSQSLRRTLGFGKANPVLDRYSLELDCSQGIVRVKSVFMHRFWSFHCDAVQHLTVGSSSRAARLVVHSGLQGNQTHELQFANEEEREEFKRAVENCRSTSLRGMRQASVGASVPSSPQLDPSILQESSSPDDGTSAIDASVHGEISSISVTAESAGADAGYKFQLFSGEAVVKGTEFPSTLLIGPVGDNNEVSHTWGRIRGLIAVTNFRVLFVPSEQGYVPFRTALQGAAPYIPLFAITYVQILYPGGRRSKSSRTYSTGLPSIVVLNCKDVRVMRVQLEGPPHVSDERSQILLSVISRMADESQRIRTVERGSPDAMLLTSSSPPTHLSLGSTTNGNGSRDDATETSGSTEGKDDMASTRTFIGPAAAPSPVLRPGSPLEATLELSGSFASSYSLEYASPDVNGWNLFADEREFKRQIGGDPTVQPFFKVCGLTYCCAAVVVVLHRLTFSLLATVLSKCKREYLHDLPIEDPVARVDDLSHTDEGDGVPLQEPPARDHVLPPTESMCADPIQPAASREPAIWKLQRVRPAFGGSLSPFARYHQEPVDFVRILPTDLHLRCSQTQGIDWKPVDGQRRS